MLENRERHSLKKWLSRFYRDSRKFVRVRSGGIASFLPTPIRRRDSHLPFIAARHIRGLRRETSRALSPAGHLATTTGLRLPAAHSACALPTTGLLTKLTAAGLPAATPARASHLLTPTPADAGKRPSAMHLLVPFVEFCEFLHFVSAGLHLFDNVAHRLLVVGFVGGD